MGVSIQIIGSVAIMLQPFLPVTSSRILSGICGRKKLGWENAGKCFIKPKTKVDSFQPFFHKVSAADLQDRIARLRSIKTVEAEN